MELYHNQEKFHSHGTFPHKKNLLDQGNALQTKIKIVITFFTFKNYPHTKSTS